ncbi:MAG: ABC transporter permease, partial [Clostridiaceae bacterium]
MDKNSSIGLVLFLGGLVSALFSFVLILYSVGSFLKQRSRQFAVLNIIGTSKKQFKRIVFFENGIISIAALVSGITLGLVFIKFFLMIAEKVIGGLNLYFYFPAKALLITIALMGGLFLAISIIAPVIMRKKNIIDLLKKEDEAEKSHLALFSIMALIVLPITVYLTKKMDTLVYPFYLVSFLLLTYISLNVLFNLYGFVMKSSKKDLKGSGLVKVSNFKYIIHT